MPHPDDVPVLDAAPGSMRLARLLLVTAFVGGVLGLSATQHHPLTRTVSAAATVRIEPAAHVAPLGLARASRTRPLVGRAAIAKPHHRAAWVLPSSAPVVSAYGMRWGRMHKGIDFGAHYGQPIRAIGDGVVVGAGYQAGEGGYGQITIIRHADGYYSAYAHQSRVLVRVGQRVHAGELIGAIGATGHVTGPHLHFEIRTAPHSGQVNPLTWLRAHHVRV